MALDAARKAQIVEDYKQAEGDTGSPEVQVALLTANIEQLQQHLKSMRRITIHVVVSSAWSTSAVNCWIT